MQTPAKILLLCCLTILCTFANIAETKNQDISQTYPKDYFRSPLGIPLQLAGTFGELRNNHFHAGIDCKTGGQQNLKLYAVAGGYVSRIKTSPRGYGNALYIDHPNGFTSVYAHLKSFSGHIGEYVERMQYNNQNFEIDEKVPPGLLYVTKSQVVARSGNTGSSAGPHLHFEIRDTHTEEALNPLLFGLKVPDKVKPQINQLAIYQFQEGSEKYVKQKTVSIKGATGKYSISPKLIKLGSSRVGLGLKTYDKQTGVHHLNGIYSLKMYDNGQVVYAFRMERISFDETRYLNCHIDYETKKRGGGLMQKCFADLGNQLNIYHDVINRGIIDISDGTIHNITFEVEDVEQNKSTLSFMIQYDANASAGTFKEAEHVAKFNYNTDNIFENEDLKIFMPYGALYNDIAFEYETKMPAAEANVYSQYHYLHDSKTPVQKYFDVSIKPTTLPYEMYDKAIIAYSTAGGRTKSLGGTWEGNYLKAESREFGKYFITLDKTAPRVKGINISNGKNMSKNTQIIMSMTDNLSGIASYNAYIDDQWILMHYDQKSNRLRYYFDDHCSKGSHTFKLVVKDERQNEKIYTAKFIR
ncbi:MAG: M23 family metallopeptidase [Chitinophagales bacterium]